MKSGVYFGLKVARQFAQDEHVKDYLTENIRIKRIQRIDGQVVLQHPWYLPHTVTAHIAAPESYDVTLLCEKPLKLRFEHSTATIEADPGCYYVLSCDWSEGAAEVVAKPSC